MSDATPLPEPTQDESATPAVESTPSHPTAAPQPPTGGPINLEAIRRMRESQQASTPARPPRRERAVGSSRGPANHPQGGDGTVATDSAAATASSVAEAPDNADAEAMPARYRSNKDSAPAAAPKVPVPSTRNRSDEEEDLLNDVLEGADLDNLMIGDKTLRVGRRLEDGARYPGKVIKVHNANVFISLGGPDEGVVSILQFEQEPEEGQAVDVLVRGFNREEGLYELAIPGEAISVNDWDDLQEGVVVEAKVESANTGGVECKVGNVRGFIPISQLSEYRVESGADYIGKALLCVVTEANPRRGNLVLSHRAVLERDKEEKRKERLASIQVGDQCEGTVRKVTDFGAFVDIGGLDGLIHVSQLSWEKIKHPSEVVNEGDNVQVRIEKIDPTTGKIGLSYRSAQDNPWNDVEVRFPPGAVVQGTVSRLANFGAFVKLTTGVEGLIHISELAHRRVSSVAQVLEEGQQVEVKVLTVEPESQRIGLSLRATQAKPEGTKGGSEQAAPTEEPPRPVAVKKHQGPLKGGTGSNSGGLFGLKF